MNLETFNHNIESRLREYLGTRTELTTADLNTLLRLLAQWRHGVISAILRTKQGLVVQGGPFAGMRFAAHSAEGCYAARLLGCYEHELHGHIERLVARGFEAILNIGCCEGYYAIGLAHRMPTVRVFAHDINPHAQALCRQLAEANGVTERVSVGGLFRGEDFSRFATLDTLVIMDIEGGEVELLDPTAYRALRGMTVIVECHDGLRPDTTAEIARRFSDTHCIKRIGHHLAAPELPDCLNGLGQLDHLLTIWEWRPGPTPWLVIEPVLAATD